MVSFSVLSALFQSCIDWNRDVLKRELGLDDDDIIDLPILFKLVRGEQKEQDEEEEEQEEQEYRAVAYYPDMVCSEIFVRNNHFQFLFLIQVALKLSSGYQRMKDKSRPRG